MFLNEIKLKLETRISFICVHVRLDAACLVINKLISVSQSRAHCNHFPFKQTKSHLVKNTHCNICVDTAEVPPPHFWMFIDWYAFSPMQIMRNCHSVHATFTLNHVIHVWHLIKQNLWIYNRGSGTYCSLTKVMWLARSLTLYQQMIDTKLDTSLEISFLQKKQPSQFLCCTEVIEKLLLHDAIIYNFFQAI